MYLTFVYRIKSEPCLLDERLIVKLINGSGHGINRLRNTSFMFEATNNYPVLWMEAKLANPYHNPKRSNIFEYINEVKAETEV